MMLRPTFPRCLLPVVVLILSSVACSSGKSLHTPTVAHLEVFPAAFIPNQGQVGSDIKYQWRSGHHRLAFKDDGLALCSHGTCELHFVGSNEEVKIAAADPLPGYVNYLIGADPSTWLTHLPTYAALYYPQLYPGINLTFTGQPDHLFALFMLSPGADLAQIAWQYDPDILLDDQTGTIQLASSGTPIFLPPQARQIIAGKLITISVQLHLADKNTVTLVADDYNATKPLTIVLPIPLLLPGDYDEARGVTVDSAGYTYVVGYTRSSAFPMVNGAQPNLAGIEDAFVSKLNLDGTALLYSTYLGGSAWDIAEDISVNEQGQVTLIGGTTSTDFPVVNPLQANLAGERDVFITTLAADGSSIVYSTFLGGSSYEYGWAIAHDQTGSLYATGETWSTDYPTLNPFQSSMTSSYAAFISKIASTGTLVYSTYLGGSSGEIAYDIAVDASNRAFVTGSTYSADFPILNPWQPTLATPPDAFVTGVSSAGNVLIFSSYLGGDAEDAGTSIVVDTVNHLTIAGTSHSADFPLVNPFQGASGGGYDMFLTRLTNSGAVVYSTYLGGSSQEAALDLAADESGNVYVAGYSTSGDYPVVNAAQPTLNGPMDAVITGIAADGNALLYSTFLGGHGSDGAYALSLDGAGKVHVVGQTNSFDFPTTSGAWQETYAGNMDAFVAQLTGAGAIGYSTYLGGGEPYPGPTDVMVSQVNGKFAHPWYSLLGIVGLLLLAAVGAVCLGLNFGTCGLLRIYPKSKDRQGLLP